MAAQKDDRGRFLPGHHLGFSRGESGNPGGQRESITATLKRHLSQSGRSGQTLYDELVKQLIDMALYDESPGIRLAATREILDRRDGKPNQSINMDLRQSDDWRAIARQEGMDEAAVIAEVHRLIESADESGATECPGTDANQGDGEP